MISPPTRRATSSAGLQSRGRNGAWRRWRRWWWHWPAWPGGCVLKRSQQEDLRGQLGQPLLPIQPEPTPKAVPVAPPAANPGTSEPQATPGSQASQAEQAMALVQACVLASNRDTGFTPEQVDYIASFFSDPVYMVGKGEQTHASLKASLTVRQNEWPKWQDNIGFIKVDDEPVADPETLIVVVRSSFFAENHTNKTSTSGAAVTLHGALRTRAETFDHQGGSLRFAVRLFPSWYS